MIRPRLALRDFSVRQRHSENVYTAIPDTIIVNHTFLKDPGIDIRLNKEETCAHERTTTRTVGASAVLRERDIRETLRLMHKSFLS